MSHGLTVFDWTFFGETKGIDGCPLMGTQGFWHQKTNLYNLILQIPNSIIEGEGDFVYTGCYKKKGK